MTNENNPAHGFAPVYDARARLLILGSYPSPKSFAAGFYYGHPQNRFWPLLAALTGRPRPQSVAQKTALLLENEIALWDSIYSCETTGASDASIQNARPNDIAALLGETKIKTILCNGAAAHRYYRRFCEAKTGVEAHKLPSTSPANAAWSFERLLAAWGPFFGR